MKKAFTKNDNVKFITYISFAALTFLGLYLSIFQRLLEIISTDFGFNKVLMGSLITVHFFGILVGPLLSGEICDKFGRKIVIIYSLALFALGLLFLLFFSNVVIFFIGLFFIGAGFGVIEGSLSTLLTDLHPKETNRIMNISQMFFSIGTVVGPFLVIAFINYFNWKLIFIINIIFVLFFLLTFVMKPFPDYKIKKTDYIITLKLFKKKEFMLLCISMIMYVGVEEGIAFWITSYVNEWTQNPLYPSLMLSAFWFSMVIGRYLQSKFSAKISEFIIIGAILASIFLVVSILSNAFLSILVSFFFVGLGLSGIWPMTMSIAKRIYPKFTGTAFGIMMACCAIGGITIPFVMGYIGETINIKWALAFCALPLVLIVISQSLIKKLTKI